MKWGVCGWLATASCCASAFTFVDGELDAWTGGPSSHFASGGNPGAYLHWEGYISGTPGSFQMLRPDFVYDPSTAGAITTLNVALDGFRIETGSPSIWSGILIYQSNQGYSYSLDPGARGNWSHREAQALTADSFNPYFSGSGHPDFTATGGVMSFGIFVAYYSEGYPIVGGFDNFLISSEPVPEPASILALCLGTPALLRRYRR